MLSVMASSQGYREMPAVPRDFGSLACCAGLGGEAVGRGYRMAFRAKAGSFWFDGSRV